MSGTCYPDLGAWLTLIGLNQIVIGHLSAVDWVLAAKLVLEYIRTGLIKTRGVTNDHAQL